MNRVIDIQSKIPALAHKKKRKIRRRFILLMSCIVILFLLLLYFQTPLSNIAHIQVEGASLVEKDEYVQMSGIERGDALWTFSIDEVVKRLQSMDTVKRASVQRKLNRTVTLTIEEKMPVAYVERDQVLVLMLEDGEELPYVYAHSNRKLPILSRVTNRTEQAKLARQLVQIEPSVFELISEIMLIEDDQYERLIIYMDDGNEVRAIISTLSEKLSYYPQLVSQLELDVKGVFDLEVGAYFTSYDTMYRPEEEGVDEGETETEQ